MRISLIIFILSCSVVVNSQLQPGFDKYEARDLIAICNSFTFLDLYNSDQEILPAGYEKRYTSGVF